MNIVLIKEMLSLEYGRALCDNSAFREWCKHLLLQAELHYTTGDLKSAETAYKASIQSAKMHQFLNDEALAYELYGIFCVENHMVNSGVNQLQVALSKYKEWGAMKKVEDLQLPITHTYKSWHWSKIA